MLILYSFIYFELIQCNVFATICFIVILGEKKKHFIPGLIRPMLEMTLVPEPGKYFLFTYLFELVTMKY